MRVYDLEGIERVAEGTALLEADALVLRGGVRLTIRRDAIQGVEAATGALTVRHAGGTVVLALGPTAAPKWAAKLTAPPPSLLDKLGVTPGALVSVVGVRDADFLAALAARTTGAVIGRLAPRSDLVVLAVESAGDLARIAEAASALAAAGALWVVHPRGVPEVQDTAVFAAGAAAGLRPTKVARFSATHTAERLVRPRGTGGRAARS